MKLTTIEFIVYNADNSVHMVTTDKASAIATVKQIGGKICKRITTVAEYEAIDEECTVWA
jgi:hypothetical protein